MSNRMMMVLIGLGTALIIMIIIFALILSHLQTLEAAWAAIHYEVYGCIGLVALFALFRLASKIYHVEMTRKLERAERIAQIGSVTGKTEIEKLKLKQEHEYKMKQLDLQFSNISMPTGHALAIKDADGTVQIVQGSLAANRALRAPIEDEEALDLPIPQAPPFAEMSHLITTERMPLCWTIDGPAYGTIDDLLSMGITGKPGRGKTVALMYYVTMLLKVGAEVVIFDPHGAMADLAILNGRVLPGLPPTARVTYLDRKEDIIHAVSPLLDELDERDRVYRPPYRQLKHPLLLLADELPVMADFDEEIVNKYKVINKNRRTAGKEEVIVPSLMYLIRRFVLEARKWRCFFIGSGQTFDADTLPTKVTENFNSRIVFFSSDRRARMSGLENDAIKTLLPAIRRAGSGVMIFDCSRWNGPMIGSIPFITVQDMLLFLGVEIDPSAFASTPTTPLPEFFLPPVDSQTSQDLAPDMQRPLNQEIAGNGFTMRSDTEQAYPAYDDTLDSTTATVPYTEEQHTAILAAAFTFAKTGKVFTREDIMNTLGWNKKKWPAIKAVCDMHNIAPVRRGE